MNTSELLNIWLVELNLYDEFWKSMSLPKTTQIGGVIHTEYQKLAIEFLKEHFNKPGQKITDVGEAIAAFNALEAHKLAAAGPARIRCSVCGVDFTSRHLSEPYDCPNCKPADPWGAPIDTRGYPEK